MRVRILTMEVDFVSRQSAHDRILNWVVSEGLLSRRVCFSNVHMCMETYDRPQFREVVNSSDLVLPDGRPIFLAAKRLSDRSSRGEQIRGESLMRALCASAAKLSLPVGLYGGSQSSLALLKTALESTYPKINIVYEFSPPFRPLTEEEAIQTCEAISASGARLVFVGLGCPKQEQWMYDNRARLPGVTMLGVGAAFDFISGAKRNAPTWMHQLMLEWLYRLITEPRRLWRRYLSSNSRFIFFILRPW